MNLPEPPLLLITDRAQARYPIVTVVAAALRGGCRWVMVREKDLPSDALSALVTEIIGLACRYTALVSVNSDAAVAATCGAAGVHLPQGYAVATARRLVGSACHIGVSVHSLAEAQAAADAGAAYVTFSPIFASASKPSYGPAHGTSELAHVAAELPIPVIALGGITPQNAAACFWAGAAGVAVMGEVMRAADPQLVVRDIVSGIS